MGAVSNIEQTIDLAVQYKLSIIPTKEGKAPMVDWKSYQEQYATPRQMYRWIDSGAKGIGLVTGKLNGIVVLDIDVKEGKDGWSSIAGKTIPETVQVKTQSGGTHFYFKYPTNLDIEIRSTVDMYGDLSGVDMRAEGGFVVMPFTPGYSWVANKGFGEIEIAEMPEWLIEDYLAYKQAKNKKVKPKKAKEVPVKPRENVSKVGKSVEEYKTTTNHAKRAKALYSDVELVEQKLLPLLNLDGQQVDGSPFNCILPKGKVDSRPSASLFKAKDGEVLYRDWRAGAGDSDYYTLPEVYASLKYKQHKKLNGPELATWSLRLLVDAGILAVEPVQALELPPELSKKKAVVKTYDGFKFLLAVKKLYDDTQNRTAFSFRFGAAWCGMSDKTLQTAMTQLQAFGYMQMVGKEGRGIRAVNVYQLRSDKR
ncbi:bifunctional DNA primase/polymerase [Lysinibacillus sp. NPDC097287]|uniref:bifunctional DNA primase/polymerase n=1 Tax=Lysinibacillus sp. NPDC097287 TaxID=3364144 RepID=UPI00382E9867